MKFEDINPLSSYELAKLLDEYFSIYISVNNNRRARTCEIAFDKEEEQFNPEFTKWLIFKIE